MTRPTPTVGSPSAFSGWWLSSRFDPDANAGGYYSGGKGIRRPQDSGLLAGRADLVEAAALNGPPHAVAGRGFKVTKEAMAGLWVAIDRFLNDDREASPEIHLAEAAGAGSSRLAGQRRLESGRRADRAPPGRPGDLDHCGARRPDDRHPRPDSGRGRNADRPPR